MTELQKTEFEMLKIFVDICERLDLKYFLVCGSALGAVKYKGFIPWDDDLDVGMFREDYNIFCTEAQKMLPPYIFLQNYETDRNFPQIYSKLRNSNTTFIEKSCAKLDINHGIYLDIFPLDGYPIYISEKEQLEKNKSRLKLKLACAYDMPDATFKAKILIKLERMFGLHKHTYENAKKLTKILSAYPTQNSELICNHGNWQGKLEYAPREQYGLGVEAEFEGLKVRVPEKYDEYLTQKYGDWRADLPDEEKCGHHYYEVCNVDKPYTEYVSF